MQLRAFFLLQNVVLALMGASHPRVRLAHTELKGKRTKLMDTARCKKRKNSGRRKKTRITLQNHQWGPNTHNLSTLYGLETSENVAM